MIRRSDLTFTGYYRDAAATADTFTADGAWLLSGDLGRIDERGFLHVTGRKKELIALSTGKKVAPLPIETRLVQSPWIAQAVLHGEGRKYITALLTLRRPVLEEWARRHELMHDWPALIRSREVAELLQCAIDEVNAGLSSPEQIRRFVVLDGELSVGGGELTPTLKVKRHTVAERYRDQLEALYR
jgi:long-chain acyl-CoA synthetase